MERGCGHPLDRRVPPLPRGRLPRARRRRRGGEAAMSFSWARVGAIVQKELRDYRRNRFVICTMAFLPLIFVIAAHDPALDHQGLDHERQARCAHRALPALHVHHPGDRPVRPRRLLRRRRARAGHPRAGSHHPHPPRGVPRRQGPGRARPHPRRRLRDLRHLPRASRRSSPIPASPLRSSRAPTSSSSCSSPRSSPAGRSGPASPSPRGERRACRPAARRLRQPSPARHRGPDDLQRDHADPRTGARARRRAAAHRRFSDGAPWPPCSTGNGSSPARGVDPSSLEQRRPIPAAQRKGDPRCRQRSSWRTR